jgi:putative multiple sugar transport system permease protein
VSATTTLEPSKAQPEPPKKNDSGSLKAYLGQNIQQYGMIAALLVIVAIFQVTTDGLMLNPDNIAALIQQNAYVFILAIGMVMVIVAGHIDLSVGSVVAFVGGVCAILMTDFELSWPVAVVISIAIGALVGCWQGFWVAYVGIPAFIVTLGGMLLFRGLAIVVLDQTVAGLPDGFKKISNGSLSPVAGYLGNLDGITVFIGVFAFVGLAIAQVKARRDLKKLDLRTEPFAAFVGKQVLAALAIGALTYLLASSADGTPIVLIIVGVLVLVYTFLMNNTIFGRHIYAMGGNLPAAMLSGVKTKRVNFLIFVNMGVLAGVAAVITTSRAGAGIAAAGTNYELDAIAAAFIGGTSVNGGIGKITGAIIGALIMGVLNMGLSIMGTDPAYQQVIKGLVLIAAVALDILNKRRGK